MPEGSQSVMTRRKELLKEAVRRQVDLLKEALGVPFGMAEISTKEYRRRWEQGTQAWRDAEIARRGIDQIQDLVLGD